LVLEYYAVMVPWFDPINREALDIFRYGLERFTL
jgi:hypothetical protein